MGEHRESDERFDGAEAEGSSHDQPQLVVHALHACVGKPVDERGVDAGLVLADGAGELDEGGQLRS
jgi:hypothetical protein